MPVIPYKESSPQIDPTVWVAPTAYITGKVFIGPNSSVFFNVAIRGDIQNIKIGAGTNIQDGAVIHTSIGLHDCIVGDEVTVGHGAILHGCTVNNACIIGMGSVILDDAVIGEECIIGAHSLVPMRMQIPPRSMVYGSPAKVIRPLTDKELHEVHDSARRYQKTSKEYKRIE
jgi:carbonic anhydrase/acetyltransferase-like protein (isoleucine patch superfamily)